MALFPKLTNCNICIHLLQHNLIKQSEANALKTVEKRSLLPRMIYLSISSAPASVKENIEANGSIADTKFSLDLKILLERYAKILEFPLHDAIELVFGVSSGKKPLEALSSETTDWMNFTVFLNAWNLSSHEIGFPDGGNSDRSTWDLVNTLLKKYVLETMKSAGPIISSPGNNILLLVQLSLCETIEVVVKWLKEQLQSRNDEKFETAYSSVQKNGTQNGSGKVFKILESSISVMRDADVGDRILEALQSWSPADVVRKIVVGQDDLLSEFLKICESKIKLLQSLRLQL
ncbi:hypothetical protein ACS0TY_014986 [Phlomoides rotata]